LGIVDPDLIQPASIDLRLGGDFLRYPQNDTDQIILGERPAAMLHVEESRINVRGEILHGTWLYPGQFILARTKERVVVPTDLAGQIHGRSSVGRLGLIVHVTAGWIDPGFDGTITLEMVNLGGRSIFLTIGVPVCTLSFYQLTEHTEMPYQGRYQYQTYTTPSRLYEGAQHGQDFDADDRPAPPRGSLGGQALLRSTDVYGGSRAPGADGPLVATGSKND